MKDDTGPWIVGTWRAENPQGLQRVVLQSDDFTHDVALVVSGDFEDFDQKLAYAKRLAERMNEMPGSFKLNGFQRYKLEQQEQNGNNT